MSNRFGISDDVIEAVRKVLAGEKMDPVGKADADIDNDGDVDKSDSYLHNRRKAIKKAMKKEEAEQMDELSKSTMGSYIKKAASDVANRVAADADDRSFGAAQKARANKIMDRERRMGKAVDKLTKEEVEVYEAKMSASQIAALKKASAFPELKKAYEPMRGKKISMDSGNKLRSIMDKIDDDKQALIRLVKADIPFVSALAVTRLISKHDMKGAEINKLKEEVDLDEAVKLGTKVKIHAPGKSYHDKEGRVGEIRHGLYKGAPKTYTVDHEGGSIQLDKKNIRVAKEEVDLDEAKRDSVTVKPKGKNSRYYIVIKTSNKKFYPVGEELTDDDLSMMQTGGNVKVIYKEEVEQATEEVKKTAPFSKPYKKVGDRKDEYGNVVKNAAKYLAKKAMKKQMAKEDIEQTDEGAMSRMDVQTKEKERLGSDKVKGGGLKTFKKKDEVDVKPKMAEASELPKGAMGAYVASITRTAKKR